MRHVAMPKRPVRRRPSGMTTIPSRQEAKELALRKFIKRQLIQENGAVCSICGKPFSNMKEITIDHIVPLSKGGATTKDNCQLACLKCNQEKGDALLT